MSKEYANVVEVLEDKEGIKILKYYYLRSSILLSARDKKLIDSVISVYKIPGHLKDVVIKIQTLDSAHKGLVMKGIDSRNRIQYMYGSQYVSNRSDNRIETIKKVHNIWNKLVESVNIQLQYSPGTENLQIGIVLYIMMRLYIRLGKHIHYRENQTQGLLTLKYSKSNSKNDKNDSKSNITFSDNKDGNKLVTLSFTGKDKVNHNMSLIIPTNVYDVFLAQCNWSSDNNCEFVFSFRRSKDEDISYLKEAKMYEFLSHLSIVPKDIRTYGVNVTFMNLVINKLKVFVVESMKVQSMKVQSMKVESMKGNNKKLESTYKKLIISSIEETAAIIGHTKGVSKKSYIATQLIEALYSLYTKLDDVSIKKLIGNYNGTNTYQTMSKILKGIIDL
jgi:hypothetical protein